MYYFEFVTMEKISHTPYLPNIWYSIAFRFFNIKCIILSLDTIRIMYVYSHKIISRKKKSMDYRKWTRKHYKNSIRNHMWCQIFRDRCVLFLWQILGPSFSGCCGISFASYYNINQILSFILLTNKKKMKFLYDVENTSVPCFPWKGTSGKENTAPRDLILLVDILTKKGYYLVIFLILCNFNLF